MKLLPLLLQVGEYLKYHFFTGIFLHNNNSPKIQFIPVSTIIYYLSNPNRFEKPILIFPAGKKLKADFIVADMI